MLLYAAKISKDSSYLNFTEFTFLGVDYNGSDLLNGYIADTLYRPTLWLKCFVAGKNKLNLTFTILLL